MQSPHYCRFIELKSKYGNEAHIILGPACDQPALALADLVRRYSIVQVSHAAQTPEISQLQQLYPYTFRTVPSYFTYRNPINAVMQFFDWLFISVVHSELRTYTKALESLGELLSKTPDAQVQQSIGEAILSDVSLERLGRVFVVLVPEGDAPGVMCTAFRRGLTGPDYQWILPGDFTQDWWRNGDVDCSLTEMRQAVESSLIATHRFETPSDAPTVSGLTLKEFWEAFEARVGRAGLQYEGDKVSRVTTTFDAVWSLALALNTSIPTFVDRGLNLTKYFQISTSVEFTELVTQAMEQTNFTGASGRVEFTNQEHGIAYPTTCVLQMQNGEMVPIGIYDSREDVLDMTFFGKELMWQGAGPPRDRPKELLQSVDLWIVVIMLFLAGAGTVFAIVLLVINCVYRKHKVIKASSPYINLLIIIGCILGFAAVVVITMDAYFNFVASAAISFSIVCNFTPWLISLGFNLTFGALFAKEWRLYRIFRNPWSQHQPLKDYHLFAIVLLLLTINAAALVICESVLPLKLITVLGDESSDFIVEKHQLCSTSDYDRFVNLIVVISIPKGLMLLLGVFLAWRNSKIKSKFFNDAKFLGIAVYGVIITCGVGVPISFFTMFAFEEDISYVASTLTINICSYLILITVFVPKILLLYRYRRKVPVSVLLGLNPSFRSQSKKPAYLSRISRKDDKACATVEDARNKKQNQPSVHQEILTSWEPAYDTATMDTRLDELQEESIEFGESDLELYCNYFAVDDTDRASWLSTDTSLNRESSGMHTRSMLIIPTD